MTSRRRSRRRGGPAQPLTSHQVAVSLIAGTTTRTGLTVRAERDTSTYPRGIKIPDREMKTLAVVDRWYPSSKTCSAFGHLLASLSLGTRSWVCPGCGVLHQRDINAAKNIALAAGLTASACGGGVRRAGGG